MQIIREMLLYGSGKVAGEGSEVTVCGGIEGEDKGEGTVLCRACSHTHSVQYRYSGVKVKF
jgi:hypothetical protein